jgi:predicted phage-related endonuclease
MTDEEKFQEERASGIGGSDMGDLLELAPYGCKKKLWFSKRRIVPDFGPSKSLKRHARRGKKLEAIIGEEYAEATGRNICRPSEVIRHRDFHFLMNHMDFLCLDQERAFLRYLEVKCPSYGVFRQVKLNGLKQEWILQSQQGMLCAEGKAIHGGAWAVMHLDTWTLIHFDVDPDPELQSLILDEAINFWPTVENGPIPEGFPPSEPRCRSCGYRYRCHGDQILASEDPQESGKYMQAPEYEDMVREIIECQDLAEEAHDLEIQAKLRLRNAMAGGPQKIKVPGAAVNCYSFTQERWDTEALNSYMATNPGIAKMFAKYRTKTPIEAMRVFRV